MSLICFFFFFFNDTATTEIYTLSLHDALPIYDLAPPMLCVVETQASRTGAGTGRNRSGRDRKSTRLNSSHLVISYAVFCLKKKKKIHQHELCTSSDDPPHSNTHTRPAIDRVPN